MFFLTIEPDFLMDDQKIKMIGQEPFHIKLRLNSADILDEEIVHDNIQFVLVDKENKKVTCPIKECGATESAFDCWREKNSGWRGKIRCTTSKHFECGKFSKQVKIVVQGSPFQLNENIFQFFGESQEFEVITKRSLQAKLRKKRKMAPESSMEPSNRTTAVGFPMESLMSRYFNVGYAGNVSCINIMQSEYSTEVEPVFSLTEEQSRWIHRFDNIQHIIRGAFGEYPIATRLIASRVDAIIYLEKLNFFIPTDEDNGVSEFIEEHHCNFLVRFTKSGSGFTLHYTGHEEGIIEKTKIRLGENGYVTLIKTNPETFCSHRHPNILHVLMHPEHNLYSKQLLDRTKEADSREILDTLIATN